MGRNEERIGVILDIDAVVSKAKAKTESLTKIFDNVGGNKGNQLRNILVDIGKEYEKLGDESGKTMTKLGDFSKAEKATQKLSSLFGKLEKEVGNIGKMSAKDLANLFPEDIANKVTKASDAIKTFNTVLENSGKGKGAISQATKDYEAQEKAVRKAAEAVEDLEKIKNGTSKKQVVTFNDKEKFSIKVEEAKAKVDELKKAYKALRTEMDDFEREERENAKKKGKESMFDKGTQNYSQPYRELRDKVAAAEQAMNKASKTAKDLNQQFKNMVVVSDLENDLKSAQAALAEAQNKAALLKKNLDSVNASEFNRALDEAKKKLQGLSGIDLSKITNLDDLNKLFNDFTNEGVEGLKRGLQQAGIEIKELDNVNDQLVTSVDGATVALKKQNQVLDDINGIKNRILQFFSLTEGVQLARRVISQATEAIRELDKAMTETATVTDFSVGDMWDALPRYTQAANELGATTLGAYETMTLFYQQGLDTNEAFEIGTETMKMARIAGLEYAEATDLMTAALRGFNMELNETSAQRVNDVYSELAAITAADTEEIANAMTKTASIANSANMEFETTAALLSQIVETTREPAETAGTAMKTIIARFTEMKKATSDIIDVDGEEVEVNKVEAALKSAGVALRDVNGEFRDLDDVFIELASRWDSLDMMTQRYVATMAAGSRQQSRFIAMMSDYDRTMELVDAAYDSAGASAKQFAKTQDSFEAKVNNLKNAWNEYLLSLANSEVVKGVIDLLTKLINIINDLTEGGGSFQSSMLKVFTAIAGFKTMGSIFGQMFSQLPTIFTQEGQSLGGALGQGIQSGINNFKLTLPFVGTLSKEIKNFQAEMGKNKIEKDQEPTFGNISKIKNISNVTKQLSGNMGQQMTKYLEKEFSRLDFTDTGEDWAKQLGTSFADNLAKNGDIGTALKQLQTDVDEKLKGTGKEGQINTGDANFSTKGLHELQKQTDQIAGALSLTGMAVSMLGSKLSEQSGALGKFGDTLEIVGNAASMAGMALAAFNAVAKVCSKLTSVAGGHLGLIIAAAAAVISAIAGVIAKHKEMVQQTQQQTIDTAKKTKEEIEANRELVDSLDDTVKAYKEGAATREQVSEAAQELISKYDLESDSVALLTGDYQALTKAIKEKIIAQEEENLINQQNAASTYRNKLFFESGLGKVDNISYGSSVLDEISLTDDFKAGFLELMTEFNLSDLLSLSTGGNLFFTKPIEDFTDQELLNFSKFLNKYVAELRQTLEDQGLDPEDSEVYLKLSKILGDTETSFEGLSESIDSASDSLMKLADIEFKKDFDTSTVKNYDDYQKQKEAYTKILIEDHGLTAEEAEEIASNYFSNDSNTKGFAQAEELVVKIQNQFQGDAAGLDIYQKYLNGEITPEEFLRLMISIDIETNTVDDINKATAINQVTSAISAPQDFYNASTGISDHINENFTIEGISETTLQGFESYLSSITSLLPSNINAIQMWEQALQQGTLGVSDFLIKIQSLLNTQSLMMSESVLNGKIYGISSTDADIKKDKEKWNSEDITEDEKKEILIRYGFDFKNQREFEEQAAFFGKKLEQFSNEGTKAGLEKAVEDASKNLERFEITSSSYNNKQRALGNNESAIENKKAQIKDYEKVRDSNPIQTPEYNNAIAQINKLNEEIKKLEEKNIEITASIESDIEPFKKDLEEAESKLEAFEQKKEIKFQIEVENAMADAEQITTLRTQLAQLKELADSGFKVDLSAFEQMVQITPQIAQGVKVLSDGTIDVSEGMKVVNEQLVQETKLRGENAAQTLQEAVAAENTLQAKLTAAIKAVKAEIAMLKAGSDDKQDLEGKTQKALTDLTGEGGLERAKIFDEEADDQSEAARTAAENVIETVQGMNSAYENLGLTLDNIQAKMASLGTESYVTVGSTAEFGTALGLVQGATSSMTVDGTNYSAEDLDKKIADILAGGDGDDKQKRLAALEELLPGLEQMLSESQQRGGKWAAQWAALLGGGNNYGVKDDDKKGKTGGNKDKNTTNTKLKNIEQQLEDLKRKREKGEINALEYQTQRNQLLTTKHGLLETDLNSKLSQTKGAVYYDKKSDSIKYNNAAYKKLSDENKTKVDKIYEEAKKICTDMNKIEDEVGSIKKNQSNDTTNEDEKLKALERDRKNGKISADEYEKQREELLTTKYGKLSSEFYSQLANNPEKDFFKYNAETDTLELDQKKYGKLSDDRKKEVKAQYDEVNDILEEMNKIEDEVGEINEKVTNDTTNNESKTEALERQLKNGKIGAKDYSSQMKDNLDDQKTKLQREFKKQLSESADKDYFKYDKNLDTLLIDEEKLVQLSEEQRDAVLKEYQTLKDINDELNDVEDKIKEAKKYLKYSTTNTDNLQQALGEDLENGTLDPATYQKEKKAVNKAENRTLKGENNSILKSISDDIGPIFYNTKTRQFEWNPMFDQSTLTPEQIEMIESWMNGEVGADGKRTGGKNAELKSAIRSGDSAAIKAIKNDYRNSGYGSLYYQDAITKALQYDELIFDTLLQEAKDDAEENVKTYNSNSSTIKDNKEENEDLTARKDAKNYDYEQYDAQLDVIKRKYQNGTLSHSQYEAQKKQALENKKIATLNELAYQTNTDTSEYANLLKYITLEKDNAGNVIGVSGNSKYYKLEGEAKQKTDEFIELLRGLCGTVGDIEAELQDPLFKDTLGGKTAEVKRAEYNKEDAKLWNIENDQTNLAEDREDTSNLQGVLSKLPFPQEMQTALSIGFTAADMGYEAQEILNYRSQYDAIDTKRKLAEGETEYIGLSEEALSKDDAFKNVVAYWDNITNTYKLNEEKFNALTVEQQAEVMAKLEEYTNEYGSSLKQIANELDGGLIQKAAKVLGKSLQDVSKAFYKTEDGIYTTEDALSTLEATLGLTEGSLDKFKSALETVAKGAEKIKFKGAGLSEEQLAPLTKFFEGKGLGGVSNLFSMVLGNDAAGFNGAELLEASTGAFGQIIGVGSDFMNWDMINGGVDMFTQSLDLSKQIYDRVKQGIEKIKQAIEQVIQYISQTTQVLIDAWTNREDYLYNYLKLIEKHLQEYEKLQRYSTQIQKGRIATADDIAKNWEDQWASLQKQLEEQTERLETRQQELDRSRWNPFMLISGWDPLSDTLYENREVKMLWDIIIGLGEAFAPLGTGVFFSQLNQLYEDYDQRVQQSYEDRLAAEQALLDIEDERLELVKVGSNEATQFEDKVLQALIQKEQEAIDELSRLNDAVTTANQKLMSTLQDNLSKIRQDRENEKKEEELGEKERRLAYLRQDTSGANAMEIKRLEKELDEQHEDYTDTLIDQKISELEKQNELAAEQRQQQIDLLQGQLDYAEKYGLYWETIYDMLYSIDENGKVVINADNFDVDGNIRENSRLAQLLGTHSDRMGMSTWQSVLDNEETKLLGLYYKAFMTRNGADGNWADYWALLDPGANDPDYTRQMAEIPGGLRGVLSRLEIGIREYFGTSNPGLVNMSRSAEQGLKNFFGKLFNYEPWETFKAEEFNKAYVEADTMNAIHRAEVGIVNSVKDGFNNFFGLNQKAAQTGRQTTEKAKSNNNNYGTQNYGAVTENYNFNIGTVGENISLDDMVDRVTSAIKGMFTGNINAYKKSQ